MLGDNVKVHFAGADGEESAYCALTAANVHYCLYSCYKYILNKSLDDDMTLPEEHVLKQECKTMNHVIQDSGLFTLMFGAQKGQKQTIDTLTLWQDKLIKFVLQNNLSATVVEIDCQKVLGVEEAWYFRERMKPRLPNRQINVFHFEDGKKGLDRLIEFSDYIAFSVPELRIVKPRSFREDTRRLVDYVKTKKPEIDIHLLGCTDFRMLEQNKCCTSADSTSWLQGVKYGHISDGKTKNHVSQFKKELVEQNKKKVQMLYNERKREYTARTLEYTTNMAISAAICKQRYASVAGNQE